MVAHVYGHSHETPGHKGAGAMRGMTKTRSYPSVQEAQDKGWSPCRRRCLAILTQPALEMFMAILAMLSFGLAFVEADMAKTELPTWMVVSGYLFLSIYVLEAIVKLYVMHLHYFCNIFNIADFLIIFLDLLTICIEAGASSSSLPSWAFLRVFRLLRLARGFKVVVGFPQLALMVKCFASAVFATLYGISMLFMVLTVWSVCAVHFIHPVNVRVAANGQYSDCLRCPNAFSTVSNSMLTFVQQIIAGDSWGMVTIPIIEEAPWTAAFFTLVFVSIHFVTLNVLMSVIVDSALKASQEDLQEIVRHKAQEYHLAEEKLQAVCHSMDQNGSGDLTEEEIVSGFDKNPEFRNLLMAMDVGKDDLTLVFDMLDRDDSGSVSYNEFISELFNLKSQDSHTVLMFIKHHVAQIQEKLKMDARLLKNTVQAGGADGREPQCEGASCLGKVASPPSSPSNRGGVACEGASPKAGSGLAPLPLPEKEDLTRLMSLQSESFKDMSEELRHMRKVINDDLMRGMRELSQKSESHRLLFSSVTDNLLVLPAGGGDRGGAQGMQLEASGFEACNARPNHPWVQCPDPVAHSGAGTAWQGQPPLAAQQPQHQQQPMPPSTWGVRCCSHVQQPKRVPIGAAAVDAANP